MINNPSVLLADEPTGALDVKTTDEIMKVFRNLNKNGTTVIIITHDMEVAGMCDRIIEISDGKLYRASVAYISGLSAKAMSIPSLYWL